MKTEFRYAAELLARDTTHAAEIMRVVLAEYDAAMWTIKKLESRVKKLEAVREGVN